MWANTMRNCRLKAIVCILAYFLVWMESTHALPFFFVVTDNSHKAIVTEYHGQIHLTLHHPGNKDKHELADHINSSIPTLVASGPDKHTDHEISVNGGERFISPVTKKMEAAKDILPATVIQTALVFVNTVRLHSNFIPTVNSTSVSPVLLI